MDRTLQGISQTVTDVITESLNLDEGRTYPLSTNLMGDLDAESLDFLDIVFRLEKAFTVKIERGRIENMLRARFPELNIKPNTPLNDELWTALEAMLPEIPSDEIRSLKKIKDMARTFRIATFVRLSVEAMLAAGQRIVEPSESLDGYSARQLGLAVA